MLLGWLANYLDQYAETGSDYIKILKKIIDQNNLKDFDNVKILPTSKEQKNVILFEDPFQAIRFANSIQVGLFELDWPESLINIEEGCEDESYRGFRVKIGRDSSEKSIQASEEISKICNPGQTRVTRGFRYFVESRL